MSFEEPGVSPEGPAEERRAGDELDEGLAETAQPPGEAAAIEAVLTVATEPVPPGLLAELLELPVIGYQPIGARDGDGALAALERDPTIELVLSDIVMPGRMSGLELARTLRKRRPELPVLLATGYSQYVLPAASDGFALVEKPYRRDVLGASIRAALEHSRRERIG